MSQSAKAQEPSMEEILASIRRIIADDETGKIVKPPEPPPAPKPAPAPVAPAAVRPAPPPPRAVAPPANKQDDIDAMLGLDAPKPAPKPPAPAPKPPASDVLDLTEAMTAAPAFRTIDGASDVVFTERAPDLPEPVRQPPPPAASPAPAGDRLISGATRAAVDSAFNSLANTVLGNNARTLEDLVKEMLRPMLKNWLDDNLPGMVERIVRAEIERVSRGR
jgi:cell pole-organizing protein PopZ